MHCFLQNAVCIFLIPQKYDVLCQRHDIVLFFVPVHVACVNEFQLFRTTLTVTQHFFYLNLITRYPVKVKPGISEFDDTDPPEIGDLFTGFGPRTPKSAVVFLPISQALCAAIASLQAQLPPSVKSSASIRQRLYWLWYISFFFNEFPVSCLQTLVSFIPPPLSFPPPHPPSPVTSFWM